MNKDLAKRSPYFSSSSRLPSHFETNLGLVCQGEGAELRRADGVGESGPGCVALGLGQQRVEVGIQFGLMHNGEWMKGMRHKVSAWEDVDWKTRSCCSFLDIPAPLPFSLPPSLSQGLTALHMRPAIELVAACKPRRANVLVAAALALRTARLMRVSAVL